ncbi:MAG: RNA polymerase sigma factor, partial [Gemmatimonadaceae bacterium]
EVDVTNRRVALLLSNGMSDATLVERARGGDRAAQNALVERYYDDCWRYAYRLLGDRADAEDAVQETFMRAIAALPTYQDHARFRGWLFTILVNQCRNLAVARTRRALRFTPLSPDASDVAHYHTSSDERADDSLARALADLEPLQREAILLRFGEELGYSDMSRLTGASESALKMRVKRGMERMRILMGRDER